jgi:hypothetical protein
MGDARVVTDEYDLVEINVPGYQAAQFFAVYGQVYKVKALDFIQAVDFTELAAPIGTPDVELNLFMTNEGLQFEWVNTADGLRSRSTMTWAEVYAK